MTFFSYSVTSSRQEFARVYANKHLNVKFTYTKQAKGKFAEACDVVCVHARLKTSSCLITFSDERTISHSRGKVR